MEVLTKFHGEIELFEESVITFSGGIPGFPEEEEFSILPLEEDGAFFILQSLKTPALAFVIVNPFNYFPEYDFTLEDLVVERLKIESPDDVLVYSILTVQDNFEDTTANLQAPVIVNAKNKKGKQVILNDQNYTTRHTILRRSEVDACTNKKNR